MSHLNIFPTTYNRLVFCAGLAAFGKKLLLGLRIKAVIDHAGEVPQAGGEAGFRVPVVKKGASLALADELVGTLQCRSSLPKLTRQAAR